MKEDPLSEKDYVPFMINKSLSYFPDTIMYANEMNKYSGLPKNMQFAFYLNAIKQKKRFSKWQKKDQITEDLNLVIKAYGYSEQKALIALELLTEDQLKELRAAYSTGGK